MPLNGDTLHLGNISKPLLLFGGPYSNWQALEAVKQVAVEQSIAPDHVICTGDIVAYCGQPVETTQSIRDWGIHVLMGNCEESFATSADDCGCGFGDGTACDLLSVEWFRFANAQVPHDQREWFAQLPRKICFMAAGRSAEVVHGSVTQINRFMYASQPDSDFNAELSHSDADLIIAGHSGIPFSRLISSQNNQRLWHNTGAIGMPANDGTTNTWYSILYPENNGVRIETHRLEYNQKSAIEAMQAVGLNNGYAACLQSGYWPSMDVLPEPEKQQQGTPLHLLTTRF